MPQIKYLDKDLYSKLESEASKQYEDGLLKELWILKNYKAANGEIEESDGNPEHQTTATAKYKNGRVVEVVYDFCFVPESINFSEASFRCLEDAELQNEIEFLVEHEGDPEKILAFLVDKADSGH